MRINHSYFRIWFLSLAVTVSAVIAFGLSPDGLKKKNVSEKTGLTADIYGNVVSKSTWTSQSQYGIYSISTDGVVSDEPLWENNTLNGNAGIKIHDRYYLSSSMSFGSMIMNVTMSVWDTTTHQRIISKGLPTVGQNVTVGYAYDRINDIAYALTRDAHVTGYQICRFNYDKQENTPICPLVNKSYVACAVDDNGNFYTIDNAGTVEKIDLFDGTATEVVKTGLTNGGLQSAFWSSRDKKIVWAMTNGQSSNLVAIDPEARTFKYAEMSANVKVIGLYTTDPAGADNAPALCKNLDVVYNASGELNGKFTGTAPATTVDGSALNGQLTAYLSVDGGDKTTFNVNAGENFAENISFDTEGYHSISLSFASGDVKGEAAYIRTFAGFDTPGPVGNLSYNLGDDGSLTLSWDEPAGVNGEILGELSYEVSLNGKLVATTSDTNYSTTIGGEMQLYKYSVVAVAAGKKSEASSAETFSFGNPVRLPYEQKFATADDFAYLKVIDGNNDGNSWVYNNIYKTAKYQVSKDGPDADEYIFLPKMELTAGSVYSVSFEVYKGRESATEKLNVEVLSYDNRNNPEKGTVVKEIENVTGGPYGHQTVDFTFPAETSGVFYIGFHCISPADAWNVEITNIRVENLGNAAAPKAIADLSVVADEHGDLKANISFTAPSTDFGDNPISSISKIEILRNGVVIKTFDNPAVGETLSYTDTTVPAPDFYDYTVRSYNEAGCGVEATERCYVGSFIPPVFLRMDTTSDFDKLIITDGDGDGHTWAYDEDGKYVFYSMNDGAQSYKDILYFPMMKLETGKTYKLQFDAKSLSEATEVMFVNLCKTTDGNSAQRLYPALVVRTQEFEKFDKYFQVSETGFYTLSVSAEDMSKVTGHGLAFRDISVAEGPDVKAPGQVRDPKATPAPGGELKTHLSFTLPVKSLEGKDLTGNLGAVVYNPADVKAFSTEAIYEPGDMVEIDVPTLQGVNNLTIVAFNEYGEGEKLIWGVYTGDDLPRTVSNPQAWPGKGNLDAKLTWIAPDAGIHNEYFDKSTLKYNIYSYDVETGEKTLLGDTADTEFNVVASGDTDSQRIYTYCITTKTDLGENDMPVLVSVSLGKPYSLPFMETNAGGESQTSPWKIVGLSPFSSWDVLPAVPEFDAQDGDGGFFVHVNQNKILSNAEIYSPTISLVGAKNPFLEFKLWAYVKCESILNVQVSKDGNNFTDFGVVEVDASELLGRNGWVTYRIDLKKFKNSEITIRFVSLMNREETLAIDDILVADNTGNDLSVASFDKINEFVEAGDEIEFNAKVLNYGAKAAECKLQFFREGELIGESEDLNVRANNSASCTFTYTTVGEDAGKPVKFTTKVVSDADCVAGNNEWSTIVNVNGSQLPGVANLTSETDGNNVVLRWNEPETDEGGLVEDSFDNYDSYVNENFGNYTVVDRDKQPTISLSTISYYNQYKPSAFMVFNPTAAGVRFTDNPEWRPRSGNKVLISWNSGAYEAGQVVENDDWLISPRVEGDTEVSVWAKILTPYFFDRFMIMYSTTTDDIESFRQLGDEFSVESADWTEFKAQLPADAKYFAIRHFKTGEGAALLLDDLSYTKASDGDLSFRGYSIEKNGKHLADMLDGTEYTDLDLPKGSYEYSVTAVYKEGRSVSYRTLAVINESGISEVTRTDATISVTGGKNCIEIESKADCALRIYAIDGKFVYGGDITVGKNTIPMAPGIYLVSADGSSSVKVIVK